MLASDRGPRRQVVMLSACSGHGFKFAPALGEVAADLTLHVRTRHDISLFRLRRDRLGGAAALARLHDNDRVVAAASA
jgi:glycine/D-amino acid oxidase-like deaminating enzyme